MAITGEARADLVQVTQSYRQVQMNGQQQSSSAVGDFFPSEVYDFDGHHILAESTQLSYINTGGGNLDVAGGSGGGWMSCWTGVMKLGYTLNCSVKVDFTTTQDAAWSWTGGGLADGFDESATITLWDLTDHVQLIDSHSPASQGLTIAGHQYEFFLGTHANSTVGLVGDPNSFGIDSALAEGRFMVGPASAVPEPASLLLVSSSLLGLGFTTARRKARRGHSVALAA